MVQRTEGVFSLTAAQRLPSQKKQLKPESRKSPQYLPLCRRNGGEIGGVVQRTEGVLHSQPRSGLSTIPQSSKINNFSYFPTPPALRATSPIRAIARQRRTSLRICPHSHRKHTHIRKHTEEDIVTFPLSTAHNRIFANFTVPSTLNHRPLTLNNKETPLPKQRRFPNNMKQLYRYFTITFFTTSPAFTI